jgi:hypothetical protein
MISIKQRLERLINVCPPWIMISNLLFLVNLWSLLLQSVSFVWKSDSYKGCISSNGAWEHCSFSSPSRDWCTGAYQSCIFPSKVFPIVRKMVNKYKFVCMCIPLICPIVSLCNTGYVLLQGIIWEKNSVSSCNQKVTLG